MKFETQFQYHLIPEIYITYIETIEEDIAYKALKPLICRS